MGRFEQVWNALPPQNVSNSCLPNYTPSIPSVFIRPTLDRMGFGPATPDEQAHAFPKSSWESHDNRLSDHPSPPSPAETHDAVRRPAHYARFPIEPITFIVTNNLPYMVGNVIKYICRFDAKNGDEDIRKAMRYCEMLLEHRKREREGTVGNIVGNPL